MEREELKEEIWHLVAKQTAKYAREFVDEKALSPETLALDIFPTYLSKKEPYTDEQADRYGLMILSCWVVVTTKYDIQMKVDYPVREEFRLFPKLGDVSHYLFSKIAKEVLGRRVEEDETGGL